MTEALVAEELIAQARQETGLERFDSDSFREGLDVYLADLNAGKPTAGALQRLRPNIVQLLANRLRTTEYLEQRPELLERPVERPVFVFGIPRTGTTLLSNL
ncbi:MAG: sulfotransferase, partial [Halioglobus sp.]|nr:sulfotransferase [Halioglobus sp.]